MSSQLRLVLVALVLLVLAACAPPAPVETPAAAAPPAPQIAFFSITSDGASDPHSVTMGLQLANHALDAGREVVLFFNVRGAAVPTKAFPADLAFHAEPIATLLAGLIQRGAEVHVCPHCMEALGVTEADLIEGARVTTRDTLFAKLGPGTNVFTY